MSPTSPSGFKRLLPHLLITLGFAAFCLLYFYPALQGKILSQGDNVSWKGMAHEAMEWHKKTGENTLWSNSMFGGMPTYTHYVPESHNFIGYIQVAVTSVLTKPAYFLFLAMLSFYALMLVLRINKWLGIVGAFAFAFSTYNLVIINAGHETKMLAIAFIPAILAGFILIYRGRYWSGAAMMGLALALQMGNMHFQISYYTVIILGFAFLGMMAVAAKEKSWNRFGKATVVALVSGIIGIGPAMSGILPTQEYQKVSMRGGGSELTKTHDTGKKGGLDKEYAFRWSNGIAETFCGLIPDLYGGSTAEDAGRAPVTSELTGGQMESLPLYWGPQPGISGPVYFGAIICFLFLLGMMVIRSPHKWWMLAVSVLAIMMSWGKNLPGFNYLLFDHLPLLNKFRTPSMILIIPEVIFPILAIWAVQEIINNKDSEAHRKDVWNKIKLAAGITAGLALILGVGASLFFNFSNPEQNAQIAQQIGGADKAKPFLDALKEDRAALARNSGIRSAFLILAAGALLGAFIKNKERWLNVAYFLSGAFVLGWVSSRKTTNKKADVKKEALIFFLGWLIFIDMVPVAHRYVNEKNFVDADTYEQQFTPRPADAQILKDTDPYYRVLDVTRDPYNDAIQAYFHKCVGGYHPAKMEIYQDLIEAHMSGQSFNSQVLNMLNTKYIIVPGGQGGAQVIPNPTACGNAWFVSNVKLVKTADEEMASLSAAKLGDTVMNRPGDFNAKETAIVRESAAQGLQGFSPYKDAASKVTLAKYGLDEISFNSQNSKEGLAVFSDIWYPYGWKAYVDGKETPIIRANYVLRALKLPAGTHNIVFKFHPNSYYTGNTIALISSILLLALIGFAIYRAYSSRREHSEVDKAWAKD